MNVTLFVTHYENKLMVAARRWRSLVSLLCKEGMHFYVVTPGLENKEYIGEFGETVFVFKTRSKGRRGKFVCNMGESRKVIASPFPYIDVSLFHWFGMINNKRVINYCSKSDMLISTYGPAGPMLFGLLIARKYNKPWVLDLRDSLQISYSENSKALSNYNRWVERKIISRASLLITVGKSLAHYLSNKYQCSFEYIYNGWIDTDPIDISQKIKHSDHYFLYAGSVYQHQLPAFKLFLGALSTYKNIKLRIRLIRDYSGNFLQWLRENGFENIVEISPPVAEDQLSQEMRNSVGALVVEDLNPLDWQKGTVTGKLFPLLVSGLPGIVISHQDVEAYKLAAKASGWFCAYDLEGSRKAIDKVISFDITKMADNKARLSEYHYATQAKKFARLCQKVLEKKCINTNSFNS
jgi:hypothetical protein